MRTSAQKGDLVLALNVPVRKEGYQIVEFGDRLGVVERTPPPDKLDAVVELLGVPEDCPLAVATAENLVIILPAHKIPKGLIDAIKASPRVVELLIAREKFHRQQNAQ